MKRYRFMKFMIDTTRNIFRVEGAGAVSASMREEQRGRFGQKYGTEDFDGKFGRWMSIPKSVISVIDEHTQLLEDIERAYITGSLYSALTGACCLGERIFNQIIRRTRESYKAHPQYKRVNNDSINKWDLAIETLKKWDILEPDTEKKYRQLAKLRNDSVHFQPKEQDIRAMAREAIELINGIIDDLFGIRSGNKYVSWCEVPGEMYLRKEYETVPFVREFYLPAAMLVGYKHKIEPTPERHYRVRDDFAYPDTEVSDSEFVRLRKEHNENPST